LKKKWTLDDTDRDLIVMWHKFNFIKNGQPTEIQSSMVTIGDNDINTAMSKTVGLPLGIAAHKILDNEIIVKGVHIPTSKKYTRLFLIDSKKWVLSLAKGSLNYLKRNRMREFFYSLN